jgi:hypothetical protein
MAGAGDASATCEAIGRAAAPAQRLVGVPNRSSCHSFCRAVPVNGGASIESRLFI